MLDNLPYKGPILAYGAIALLLAGAGQWAKNAAGKLADAQELSESADGEPSLDELGAFAPLAGSLALMEEAGLAGVESTPAPDPEARPREHVPFDGAPAAARLHGAPARAEPRSVTLALFDAEGEPLFVDDVDVEQGGDDGTFEVQAYRSSAAPNEWLVGSPGITSGAPVTFLVRATVDGRPWKGDAGLESTPEGTDLRVGRLQLRPVE